jgi:hypothetical protein
LSWHEFTVTDWGFHILIFPQLQIRPRLLKLIRYRIPHALHLSAHRNMKRHQRSTFSLALGSILKAKTQFKHRLLES